MPMHGPHKERGNGLVEKINKDPGLNQPLTCCEEHKCCSIP